MIQNHYNMAREGREMNGLGDDSVWNILGQVHVSMALK